MIKGPNDENGNVSVVQQKRFWNEWDACYREERPLDRMSQRRGAKVLEWIQDLHLVHPAILDLGCANGWLSEKLAAYGSVTATDLADEVVSRAQARLPQIQFLAGDFLQLNLPPSSFDLVVTLETISCVCDQQAFVDGVARVLRPGGYLMLTTHNRFVFERMEGVAPVAPGQIRQWLGRSQLSSLLQRHFRVLRFSTIGPAGHGGVLRFVNSYKLSSLMARLLGPGTSEKLKERTGFGQTMIVLCRRAATL